MKNVSLKVFGVFLILILFSTQKSIAQIDLSGAWNASCAIEKSDEASINFCSFCPYNVSEDKTGILFEGFEMVFEEDYFNLIVNEVSTKVDCKIDKDIDTLEFTYNENQFKFKVLSVSSSTSINYILKDSDGMLIFLEKKDNN